jgi:MFS family permease
MSKPQTTTNEVLQLPAVRLLLASTAAAAVAQNVLLTVLFKQVFDLTGNPLDIAFIGLAQFVPALLLVLVSGWVADRFDRRRVAGLFLGGRGVCAMALIVFSVRGSDAVWQLFLIAFVLGTADAMLAPARRSVAPFVAPQRLFPSVIALWTATFTASAIIGPILGGFIYSVGAAWAYGVAAALQFARTEGIVPAPEPTHAIAAAIREALACKESGEEKVILTALCGHGHLDLASYEKYLSGEMVDYDLPDSAIAEAMASVPVIA